MIKVLLPGPTKGQSFAMVNYDDNAVNENEKLSKKIKVKVKNENERSDEAEGGKFMS